MYTMLDEQIEIKQVIQKAILDDDEETLRHYAHIFAGMDDTETALELLDLASKAHRNVWAYDEWRDNNLQDESL